MTVPVPVSEGGAKKPAFVRELLGRSDYRIIGEIVEPKSRVLDLGCGDGALLAFLQSSYEAAANAAKWDRGALECEIGKPGVVRAI